MSSRLFPRRRIGRYFCLLFRTVAGLVSLQLFSTPSTRRLALRTAESHQPAVNLARDWVHTRGHGHVPASAGFAYSRSIRRVVAVLRGLAPVAPIESAARRTRCACIAAGRRRCRRFRRATSPPRDGWALRANDLVGASSYSPLPLADVAGLGRGRRRHAGRLRLRGRLRFRSIKSGPTRAGAGGSDPGAGCAARRQRHCRRDAGRASRPARAGARSPDRARGGTETLMVRRPRLRIVNVPGGAVTANLIAESARTAGAGCRQHRGRRARWRIDCASARWRRLRSADHGRRQRRRPQRCRGNGTGRRAAR